MVFATSSAKRASNLIERSLLRKKRKQKPILTNWVELVVESEGTGDETWATAQQECVRAQELSCEVRPRNVPAPKRAHFNREVRR